MTRARSGLARRFAFGVLCVGLSACSSPVEFDYSVSGDAPFEDLVEALSPCPNGIGETDVPWNSSLSGVEQWYQVVDYDGAEIPSREPAVPLDVVSVESGEATTINAVSGVPRVEGEYPEPALVWAVDEAELYLGTNQYEPQGPDGTPVEGPIVDGILVVMVALPDGSPFFAGPCGEQFIGNGLRETFGEEDLALFVEIALELTGEELNQYVLGELSQ